MARRAASYAAAVAVGVGLGVFSALYLAGLLPSAKPVAFGDVEIEGWNSDFAIGSEAANPYTRARIARHGLLALAKSEAVYFTRSVDDSGRALTEKCSYRLRTGKMPAQWWSITLYDAESMLPINDDGALSINANQDTVALLRDEVIGEGVEALIVARRPEGRGLSISSRNAGNFDLTLRFYVPDEALLDAPAENFDPPSIERIECAEGTSR